MQFRAPVWYLASRLSVVTAITSLFFLLVASSTTATAQSNTRSSNQSDPQNMRRRPMTPEEVKAYQRFTEQDGANTLAAPKLPPGFPLPADEQQYVEQLLEYWQKVSDQVQQYKCDFTRYEFDTSVVNLRDPRTNLLYESQRAFGQIRFAAPGKARFETSKLEQFAGPPESNNGQPRFTAVEGHSIWGRSIHECWVCTGDAVYDFDFKSKRSYETKIPPRLQGNVVESPLPFLFGAKKDEVLARYWVRYVPKFSTDANGQRHLIEDEYWLEVYPKRIEDARIYSKIDLILSADPFMPKAMHMYAANYNPQKNNLSSRQFVFENRKINGAWSGFQNSLGLFVKPRLPLGWKTVSADLGQKSASAAPLTSPSNSVNR